MGWYAHTFGRYSSQFTPCGAECLVTACFTVCDTSMGPMKYGPSSAAARHARHNTEPHGLPTATTVESNSTNCTISGWHMRYVGGSILYLFCGCAVCACSRTRDVGCRLGASAKTRVTYSVPRPTYCDVTASSRCSRLGTPG